MRSTLARRSRLRALLACSSLALLAACGGGDDPVTPPAAGTLAVAVAPASLTVPIGGNGATAATITRGGSFTGTVTLAATGAPAGVTVTLGTPSLGAGVTTSTVTVAVDGTAAAGTTPITITASGSGVTAATATLSLTISPASSPTVSLSVAPAAPSIQAGAAGSATATIVRGGGFTDAVTLTATGAPSGMSVAFTPATIATGSTTSAIAITVAGSVLAGTYPVTISATGTGIAPATATLNVTVTGVVSGSTVTLSYCAADAPIWLAVQDGNGAWSRVTPNSGTNTYQFTVASGKAGIAAVDTVGSGYAMSVYYATTSEINGFGGALTNGQCGSKTVNGTVANVGPTQVVNVTLGYSTKFVVPIPSPAFALTNVADGAQDLFAARVDAGTQRADKLILRRGLNIANGGSMAVLDFNATEAFAPASANVTITGLGADTASFFSVFNGQRGSAFGFLGFGGQYTAGSSAQPVDAVPLAKLASGELQQVFASAEAAGNSNSSRTVGVFFRNPANQTLALGPVLTAPTVSRIAGGAYSRARVQSVVQSDYGRYFTAEFSQTGTDRSTILNVTSAYTAGAAWDLTIPDLSAASGWNPIWGLQNGTPISWSVTGSGGSLFLLDASVNEGSVVKSASLKGATTLP